MNTLNLFSSECQTFAIQVCQTSTYARQEALATTTFCKMFDDFVDSIDVRNTPEVSLKRKSFLKLQESLHKERISWLMELSSKCY